MRMACLDKRARDVERGTASMDTFTPIVLELLAREFLLFACCCCPPLFPLPQDYRVVHSASLSSALCPFTAHAGSQYWCPM